jgi:RNA polymerase sigma factor (sigma-70 family)
MRQHEGNLPSERRLKELGRHDLRTGIAIHGGMKTVRGLMGQPQAQGRPLYLNDFEKLKKDLQPVIRENGGVLPSERQLLKKKRHDLTHGIRIHGGFRTVRGMLEQGQLREASAFKEWGALAAALKPHIEANGGFWPSSGYLRKKNRYDLVHAILKHHGGFAAAREKHGLQSKPAEHERMPLADWDYFKGRLEEIEGKLGRPPKNSEEIIPHLKSDAESVSHFAQKYHGGWREVYKKMGWARPSLRSSYSDRDILYRKLAPMVQALGRMPSHTELRLITGNTRAGTSIRRHHGGMDNVRSWFGFPPTGHASRKGKFPTFEHLAAEMENTRKRRGKYPTHAELRATGRTGASNAIIYKHDGMKAVLENLGKRRQTMEAMGPLAETVSKAMRGDERALAETVKAHRGLIESFARKKANNFVSSEDLAQEGVVGLLSALQRYNFHEGKFGNYALKRANGQILDHMRAVNPFGRNYRKVMVARDELLKETGKEPSISEIVQHSGLDEAYVARVLGGGRLSLDELSEEKGFELAEESKDVAKEMQNKETIMRLSKGLNGREKKIVWQLYGLGGARQKTLKEIAEGEGVTESRISQLHTSALEKMRKAAEKEGGNQKSSSA